MSPVTFRCSRAPVFVELFPKRRTIMRAKCLLTIGVVLSLLLTVRPAHATNFHGTIRLVQVTSAGLRFLTATTSVSLYATGDAKEVLVKAFFRKGTVDIGYAVIPCPAGITGTCGNVNF